MTALQALIAAIPDHWLYGGSLLIAVAGACVGTFWRVEL